MGEIPRMPQQQILTIATRNSHKTDEIRHILGDILEIRDVTSIPGLPEIKETGTTFLENARLKAIGISRLTGGWVLADDSGLEVDALDGRPGVWSSSFGGEEGNHALNNERLMAEMRERTDRRARFRCTLVLARDGVEKGNYRGSVEGRIAETPSGDGGFGYDPLFIPDGYNQSLAELGPEIKSQLSHRGIAVREICENGEGGKSI